MIIKSKEVYILILFFFISCKKEEIVYFDDGKIKYIKIIENGVLHFRRFDQEGNIAFIGKFKDSQLIDTLFARDQDFDYIVKIDSSDYEFFYGTYISKYSTGKISKISPLRYTKSLEIDSILSSPLFFGKEEIYKPDGEKGRERYYEINGKVSEVVTERIYDESLK